MTRFVLGILMIAIACGGCSERGGGSGPAVELRQGEATSDTWLYPNGKRKRIDFFDSQGQLARSIWWLPDGRRYAESVFVDGHGVDFHIRNNGKLERVVEIHGGVANGHVYNFGSDGSPISRERFVDGKPVERKTEIGAERVE